jgi:hypothetical protein
MESIELGFRVEEIDVTGATVHEELDDRPCTWGMQGASDFHASGHGRLRRRQSALVESIGRYQRGQRGAVNAGCNLPEETSPGGLCVHRLRA